MKKVASIIAVIAALGIAVFAFSGRSGGRANATDHAPAHPSHRLSSKTERPDDDHAPERFDSLDAGMRALARELEKTAIKWRRNRPEHESFHRTTNDWKKYSTDKISALTTEEIRQLGEWLLAPDPRLVSELHEYRQAAIMIWASREPEAVRARLMEIAESSGFLESESDDWSNPGRETLADNFHHARVGHAMKDPKSAWEAFLKEDADPRMKFLVDKHITVAEIFREYAIQLPDEAWNLALTTNDKSYCNRMVEGFADGAPAGQNWEAISREFADSLTARGLEVSDWPFQAMGERWAMEDPIAALEWYARAAPPDALRSANNRINGDDDPFADDPPPADPAQAPTLLKAGLLVGMYGSYKDRSREAMVAFDQLNQHGDGQLVAAALDKLVGTDLLPYKIPLLEVIPGIPSPEDRNTLFLQAVHAIPNRSNDPFSTDTAISEGPNASLIAVRELAARLNLPDEIRAEAEAAFRNIEAEELKSLEESRQNRRGEYDPFSSSR